MITYNIKLLFEDKEQENYWRNILNISTSCYNDISDVIWNNLDKGVGLKTVHSLVYNQMREKYPVIPTQMIIKLYKLVISNYQSNKKKYKCIKKTQSCQLDKRLYSNLTSTSIRLATDKPRYRKDVKFKLYDKFNELAKNYVMKDPNMFIRNDEIYLGIPFDTPNKPVLSETYLGIDLGVRRLVTTSDGCVIDDKKLKERKRKIRKLKRELQSKKTIGAKRHLEKLKRKEHNINKFYVHHIANQILKTEKSIIVMEDLNKIKLKTSKTDNGFKRTKHNNRMAQVPFYMLKQILSYKAPLIGKQVVTVSPFNTSKIDCLTGKTDGNRCGCRYYSKTGKVLDADWNAAINIVTRKHPISFNEPIDGKLNFIGRALVSCPYSNESNLDSYESH